MNDNNPVDENKRTIVLIYGMLENGSPFWLYAAVRPKVYNEFLTAYREKKIDVYHFGHFGEIIVCGEGKAPPDDVTLKVAELYQTDAETLKKSMKDEPPPG